MRLRRGGQQITVTVVAVEDESEQELASLTNSVSNGDLTSVGGLELGGNISELHLVGRTDSSDQFIKGEVVNLSFSPNFTSYQEQVTVLILESINLDSFASNLTIALPMSLTNLTLANCLLTELPHLQYYAYLSFLDLSGNYITQIGNDASLPAVVNLNLNNNSISSFEGFLFNELVNIDLSYNELTAIPKTLVNNQKLVNIHLQGNQIHEIDASITWNSLIALDLSDNGVSRFEAVFPAIETLFLSNHNLTEIPASIYNRTNLSILYLDHGQQKMSPRVSEDQFNFLSRIHMMVAQDDFEAIDYCEGSLQSLPTAMINTSVTLCVGNFESNDSSASAEDATTLAPAAIDLERKASSTSKAGLIAGVIAGVLAVLIIAAAFLWKAGRQSQRKHVIDCDATPLWKDDELVQLSLRPEDIEDVRPIGGGAWGVVWLVRYHNSTLYASKRLRTDHITREMIQAFADEIKLVSKFDHPNIVKLVGAAWTIATDLQALFEYMKRGDLRDYLLDPSTSQDWDLQKLQIATDIIDALVYVHSFDPLVVHRDIKSRNVLLTEIPEVSSELRAKLTDFGSSRYKSVEDTMTIGVGTARWLAPEVLSSESYDQSADIFSFGVVLSELDTHALPYEDERSEDGGPLSDVAILQKVAMGSLRPRFSEDCPSALRALADRCLLTNASERPLAPEIAYALRTMRKEWGW